MFEFEIKNTDGLARTGVLNTPHGDIYTPVFMPCGTKATVKSLHPYELSQIGTQILLGNTYHLHLRPGSELIKKMGGLHEWMKWDGPILTDSGGYQVFSLKDRLKINDERVEFASHLDGTPQVFTPESVVQTQVDLGSDIMMVLDECAPGDVDMSYARKAMERTHQWAERSLKAFQDIADPTQQAIFPIIQGVMYDDLRIESAKFISSLDTKGIAIGGLSVGESKELMYHTLDVINPHLPKSKPRYLMGVGSPEDLVEGVARGVDMFDCVLPTRLARHATFWDEYGRHNILNAKYKDDESELAGFTKSYIHHLMKENELLGHRLLSLHNLRLLHALMEDIRHAVNNGKFEEFRKEFYSKWGNN